MLNLIGAVLGIVAIKTGITRGDEFMILVASTCVISNVFLMLND